MFHGGGFWFYRRDPLFTVRVLDILQPNQGVHTDDVDVVSSTYIQYTSTYMKNTFFRLHIPFVLFHKNQTTNL
jgi:hypothetical protein